MLWIYGIEQAIVAALYAAPAGGPPDEFGLRAGLREAGPLSLLMAGQVQALRGWAASRTVPAD